MVFEVFYKGFVVLGFEVFYDDCKEWVGGKFVMMDLIGLLWWIIVGFCGLRNGVVELISCCMGESEEMLLEVVVVKIVEIYVNYCVVGM